jgi:chloramphenicol 3-O-phosphotransferase
MAAGKSSVAQALAERLPTSVHLGGDAFRRMIVNGRADMTAEPSSEALAQLSLRYRTAAAAARLYRGAGFSVVYQDVVLGPALREVVSLHDLPLHLVVLCPTADAVRRRESGRSKCGYGDLTVDALDGVLRHDTPRWGLWLDTSDLTVEETVDRVLADLEEARIGSHPGVGAPA